MKQDRLSTLRQRLKRGSFEFGALLEGVSTLDESDETSPERAVPSVGAAEEAFDNRGIEADPPFVEELPVVELETFTETRLETDLDRDVVPIGPILSIATGTTEAPPQETGPLPSLFAEPGVDAGLATRAADHDRLRFALESLGCRLLQELGAFRTALAEGDAQEGGFHLAHINQVLELLQDIDPEGELARQLGTAAAPPPKRTWPASSWTVVEFASSPFSGLLPPRSNDAFVRDLLYSAWGVSFDLVS